MKQILYIKIFLFLLCVLTIYTCKRSTNLENETEKNQFVGTWKFISLIGKSAKGDVIYPYSENLFGRLMYDSKGFMSVLLMKPDRPKFASGDMMNATPEELESAFEGFDAYCGTYTINYSDSSVTHHLQGAKFPNWVSTDQIRYFKFKNDTLHLKAPPILAYGVEWTFEAVLVKL